MIYTTKELIEKGETQYSLRQKLADHSLRLVERGIYYDENDSPYVDETFICKKYPNVVLTGLSAFFIYGLTDVIPDYFYLATKQHSYPIKRKDIKQSYQDESIFNVGVVTKQLNNGNIKIYDLERLLIELFRLKEKYPRELYYEVLASFRKIKDQIDYYKLNQYLKYFSNGKNLLYKIKEMI